MPIHLPEPAPTRPADGKGFNRLSLNAHMGVGGAQCALLPRSYATLLESQDTRRARWGGFGSCTRGQGACGDCPVLTDRPVREVAFNAPRVLLRVETLFDAGATLMGLPDSPHATLRTPQTCSGDLLTLYLIPFGCTP